MNKVLLVDDEDIEREAMAEIIPWKKLDMELVDMAWNGIEGLEKIRMHSPDIVITDIKMPVMDGITFVKQASEAYPQLAFIMLSQVAAKDMISSAYESGIEFFIQKPINSIEVENVIKKVVKNLTMQRTLTEMQSLFMNQMQEILPQEPGKTVQEDAHIERVKDILQKLGVIGEIGSKDIVSIVDYMITNRDTVADATLVELCSKFTDNPKSMEQRIRRTANSAMVNLANLGIEDYSNDTFIEYSNTLFNFEQVRREMDYIRGKEPKGGNVKIRNFLNALVSYCYK